MSKRPSRPKTAPRNPLNGFMLFSDAQKKAMKKSGQKGESLKKQLTTLWRSSPSKRHHYNKKAKELMEKYNKEMEEFKNTKEGKKYLAAMKAYTDAKKSKNSKKKKKGSKKKKERYLANTKLVSFTAEQIKALQKNPKNRTPKESSTADALTSLKNLKISKKVESKGAKKMKGEKKKGAAKKAQKDKKGKKDKKKSKKGPKKA